MSRLPQVNGDDNTWGAILNDYLSVSHAADGTLNANTVGATQLANSAVTSAKIANYGAANGVASLDATGRLPEAQVTTRLTAAQLGATYAPIAAAPTGGTTGQVLAKNSATNYDVAWKNPAFANVQVSTGNEARPSATFVMWLGGTTQPTNMAVGDVWMKAA